MNHLCPSVGRLVVGWLIGRLIDPKRAGSDTSMLLSEHLFIIDSHSMAVRMTKSFRGVFGLGVPTKKNG